MFCDFILPRTSNACRQERKRAPDVRLPKYEVLRYVHSCSGLFWPVHGENIPQPMRGSGTENKGVYVDLDRSHETPGQQWKINGPLPLDQHIGYKSDALVSTGFDFPCRLESATRHTDAGDER